MNDYSHFLLEHEKYYMKAKSYLQASQSMGDSAAGVALINAECKLLEAIASLRGALAAIRDKQVHPGAF